MKVATTAVIINRETHERSTQPFFVHCQNIFQSKYTFPKKLPKFNQGKSFYFDTRQMKILSISHEQIRKYMYILDLDCRITIRKCICFIQSTLRIMCTYYYYMQLQRATTIIICGHRFSKIVNGEQLCIVHAASKIDFQEFFL